MSPSSLTLTALPSPQDRVEGASRDLLKSETELRSAEDVSSVRGTGEWTLGGRWMGSQRAWAFSQGHR